VIEFWLPFGAALLASAFMAWAIGAGSSGATPFAPAVGANAISVMRAAFIVGILGFLGAALQGASVSEAVGSDLVVGLTLPTAAVIVVLVTAAGLMAIGIVTGYPIATAFTVTGTVIGAGLALGGDPAWAKYTEIGTMWLLTPFVGSGVAYGIASILPRESVDERDSVPILAAAVGAIVVNIEFALLASGDRLPHCRPSSPSDSFPVSRANSASRLSPRLSSDWLSGSTSLGTDWAASGAFCSFSAGWSPSRRARVRSGWRSGR